MSFARKAQKSQVSWQRNQRSQGSIAESVWFVIVHLVDETRKGMV